MVEHVGAARLPEYLRTIDHVLRPGGLFVNHGITQSRRERERESGPFILRHVFPGAYLDDLGHLVSAMEDVGFEVVDVQSLRPHYALTLARWFERFAARRSDAGRFVPDRTLRLWDLYLAGCARAFEQGLVGVHQVLLAKPDHDGRISAALTREEMALPLLREIGEETARLHPVTEVRLVHRLGHLRVGEASVAVAVASPHRKEAFAACRHAIDALKARVPIWKKEHYADGSAWLDEGPAG